MKISIIILIFITTLSHIGIAQCLVLKIDLDECQSCRSIIADYLPENTGIPLFVVFPKEKKADSTDIDYIGNFKKSGVGIIYNDYWFDKLNTYKKSRVVGLDGFGNIFFNSDLVRLNDSTKAMLLKLKPYNQENATLYSYKGNRYYSFNIGLGVLKIKNAYTNQHILTIRSSEVDIMDIADKLNGPQKNKLKKYGVTINRDISSLKAKFSSFVVEDNGNIILKYNYHNTPDSISENITDDYCLIRFDSTGKRLSINPIELPSDLISFDIGFLIENNISNNLYILTTRLDRFEERISRGEKHINYIAVLKQSRDTYRFSDYVKKDLPLINKVKYFEDNLSLYNSHFPYVIHYLDNKFYNINTDKYISIINDSIYKSSIAKSDDIESESFFNYGIVFSSKKGEICVPYKFRDEYSIFAYNIKTGVKTSWPLPIASSLGKVIWLNIFNNPDMINVSYIDNSNRKKRISLPLSLFLINS